MKRGRLSKVEKYYIEGNSNMPVAELAELLDRGEEIIQKHIDTIPKTTTASQQPAKEEEKDEAPFFKLMGRKKRGDEKVATVMTRAASEMADDTRPKRVLNKKLQKSIHKPFNR